MADNVKSVSVKIGADVSGFTKSLNGLNKEINNTQKLATALQKGLELEFDESRFVQAQKQVQAALAATEQKAQAIRDELKFLEDTGAVDTAGYQKVQLELAKTETTALKLKQQLEAINQTGLKNTQQDTEKLAERLEKGAGYVKNMTSDFSDLSKKLKDSSTYGKEFSDTQAQAKQKLEDVNGEIYAMRIELEKAKSAGLPDEEYQKLANEINEAEKQAKELEQTIENTSKLDIDRLSQQFTNIGNKIEGVGRSLTGISTAAGAAAVGILAAGKSAAASGAEIDDLAQRSQISAEKIQELSYIAMQTGVEQNQLQKAIIKTRAVFADFATGTENTATKALERLNIDISKFENSEDAFDGIISALSQMDDLTEQAAIANEIFGDRLANNLIPYINAGDEAIAQFKEEFAAIPSLTNEQIAALAGLDDQFNRLTTTLEYQKMELGVALIPVWESLIEILDEKIIPAVEKAISWFEGLSTGQKQAMLAALALVAALAPTLIMIGKVSQGVGTLIKLFGSMTKATAATTFGIAALGGALALGLDLIVDWQNMSTVEKILKTLAVAALTAAAAVAVFHASWSMGIAVGAIAAGIVAAVAAINAAKKELLPEEDDIDVDNISGNFSDSGYNFSSSGTSGVSKEYYDNSSTQINITMNATGNLDYDVKELADAVNKQLVNKKLSYR